MCTGGEGVFGEGEEVGVDFVLEGGGEEEEGEGDGYFPEGWGNEGDWV